MNLNRSVEHFVTLFDSNFLPMGMTLYDSLITYAQPFHLWILCMDEMVEKQLKQISLSYVTLISLKEIETQDLLAVKSGRTLSEYCWTLTPFTPQAVFDREATIERVTYLDADVFFFDDPRILLNELSKSGKHVLITEHAYAPEYNYWLPLSGRFCVQFTTFRRTLQAAKIMKWWQDKCLEWCFARFEDGKFGDQKYLDLWPDLFSKEVHILKQVNRTLAPWNVRYFTNRINENQNPVFFHFHNLRIIAPNKVRLYGGYHIGRKGDRFYDLYFLELSKSIQTLKFFNISLPVMKLPKEKWALLKYFKRVFLNRTERYKNIN